MPSSCMLLRSCYVDKTKSFFLILILLSPSYYLKFPDELMIKHKMVLLNLHHGGERSVLGLNISCYVMQGRRRRKEKAHGLRSGVIKVGF